MITKKHLTFIAVGACILLVCGLGSQKNPVERPVKGYAHATAVITFGEQGPLSVVSDGFGEFSHLGPFTSLAIGVPDPSGDFFLKGTTKAANGDQLFWQALGQDVMVITGGTGRFAGASGILTCVYNEPTEFRDGPVPWIMIAEATGLIEGTITY
jgi:hypothetical protein